MDTLTNILDDLADHITVLKELGQRTIEMDPQTVRELTAPVVPVNQQKAIPGMSAKKRTVRKREPLSKSVLQSSKLLSPEERLQELREIETETNHCFDCGLCKSRIKPLIGQGNSNSPDIMFIGPAPDAEDEKAGKTFSGPAGDLLTKMIEAMGYQRGDLFLTNICKCRPANDRPPLQEEIKACTHFLEEQIKIIRPKAIIVLGAHAIKGLFQTQSRSTSPQGAWTQYHGIPVMPTFHPKYILRFHNDAEGQQKQLKSSVWRALKAVMMLLKRD
ncbi:MAG: uracil-DNA glycosylase [Kiritimatiellae bacterium]|jgi:uracil-DNA glycosylase family 4|nr:uracil-DNA glycosylase [Kiritimatiellia bacterium]